jgi:hypothetical protein
MKTEALFIFLILLLGLLLCSFLGKNCSIEDFTGSFSGNLNIAQNNKPYNSSGSGASTSSGSQYDNYNHYTGSSTQLMDGSTFYGENGTTAVVNTNSDGSQSLQITLPGSSTPVTFSPSTSSTSSTSSSSSTPSTSSSPSSPSRSRLNGRSNNVESYTNYNFGGNITKFTGPNGSTATIINTQNGQKLIKVTTNNATYIYYSQPQTNSNSNINTNQYYGPYGGSAGSVTGPYGNTAYYAQGPNGNTVAGVSNNNSSNNSTSNNDYSMSQYYGPYGGSAGSVTGPYGNTAYYAQGPNGNTVAGVSNNNSSNNNEYYNTLPPGIPKSQIPNGQEDLYILKSEIVPPVCPACPSSSSCPRQEPCPPCPACARCPEPAFECKKVPNYDAINNEYLPAPVLNDFSQFGM